MRSWTVHLRRQTLPRLIPEGFSRGAFLFGPLWLLSCGAWIPAVLQAAAYAIIARALPGDAGFAAGFGLALLVGFSGNDLVSWSLGLRGYVLSGVVVARDAEGALLRLLEMRPELATETARLLR
ncbi:MAG TPA: DUF2628 domain-containing protein [Acidisphaera sp.]|nr:DUF2628 domain-containing protein [Acidisphaera sp.]